MRETENREFAYGKDSVDGCVCPAVAAGFSPSSGDDSIVVAERYDQEVKDKNLTTARSIIDEEAAKEAWLSALEHLERKEMYQLEVGREIARRLDWL